MFTPSFIDAKSSESSFSEKMLHEESSVEGWGCELGALRFESKYTLTSIHFGLCDVIVF